MRIILDSCLLLAFLRKEKNWQQVKKYLQKSRKEKYQIFLCWINLAEVYYKVYREKGEIAAGKALSIVKKLPLNLIIPDEKLFLEASRIKGNYPIALPDCFITALAKIFKATILTGDPEFKKVEKETKIKWLKK